jgi:hypothetical protein
MLFTRRNFKAGRPLKTFPLEEENGVLGFKLGYCSNCNEAIHLSRTDSQEILASLFRAQKEYKKLLLKLEPKFTIRHKLIKWLVGSWDKFPTVVSPPDNLQISY